MIQYNIPEKIYILHKRGTELMQKFKGRNRTIIENVNDVLYESAETEAVPYQLKFISDAITSHEVDDTKRLYLMYDTKNNRTYVDTREGKTLVGFTNYSKAQTHLKHLRKMGNSVIILTCSHRGYTRKWAIDQILEDLQNEKADD